MSILISLHFSLLSGYLNKNILKKTGSLLSISDDILHSVHFSLIQTSNVTHLVYTVLYKCPGKPVTQILTIT